jgi:hypothetical protein
MDNLTPSDFAKSLDVSCEAYEASGLTREDICVALEEKLEELRGDRATARQWGSIPVDPVEDNPVAFMPLP